MKETAQSMEKPRPPLKEGERLDDTGFGGYGLIQKPEEFCYGVDAVLLSDFAAKHIRRGQRICDLGTGTGIVPLILAHKTEDTLITGVEIQRDSWDRACRMAKWNGLENRLTFLCGDVAQIACGAKQSVCGASDAALRQLSLGSFQSVTANPPYMVESSALKSDNEAKRIARHETTATLRQFVKAAALLLAERGEFCMVHRPSRLVDIMAACREFRLEPKELRFVSPREGEVPNILLIRCKKGAGSELKILPPLAVHEEGGGYSEEIMRIYERM